MEAAGLRDDLLAVNGAAVNLRGHHRDRGDAGCQRLPENRAAM